MPGLFIQRQAEALTPWCDVAVISLHPDPHGPPKKEVDFSVENEVRVLRVYYRIAEGDRSSISKAKDLLRYYRIYSKAIKSIYQFKPQIIHAHILTRTAVMAWKFSRVYKIPFVISEHWSRYFKANDTYHGWLRRNLTSYISGQAVSVISVSEPLMEAMKARGIHSHDFHVIPNIVDSARFTPLPVPPQDPVKTVIHISCFEEKSKNITGFLEAIRHLSNVRNDFRCLLVGEGPDLQNIKEYADYLGLHEPRVTFTGLKTGDELIDVIRNADVSVVTSRYETFGTVIIESLACGIPVLSTAVGVAPDLIRENNGMVVEGWNVEEFSAALGRMLDQCRSFDRQSIRSSLGDRFTSQTVGLQLANLYRNILNDN